MAAARLITREEMITAFRPLHAVLESEIAEARKVTTLKVIAARHPEITRQAHLQRIAGGNRWMLIADGLVRSVGPIDGFSVLSDNAQHNQGQYVFGFPGGVFTVKREPHDKTDPADGRYIAMTLEGILDQAELAPGLDPADPITVYLSVTDRSARLKVTHSTLSDPMTIPLADLAEPAEPIAAPAQQDRPRARARSTRVPSRTTSDRSGASECAGPSA